MSCRHLIIFVDESGVSERPTRVRTWGVKGETPVVQFHFNWHQLSLIAGMHFTGMCFRLHEGAIAKEQVVEFLKALLAHFRRPLLILRTASGRIAATWCATTWPLPPAAFSFISYPGMRQTSIRSSTSGPGSSATRWPTSVPIPSPSSRTPPAASSNRPSAEASSSLRAGSRLHCSDVTQLGKTQ